MVPALPSSTSIDRSSAVAASSAETTAVRLEAGAVGSSRKVPSPERSTRSVRSAGRSAPTSWLSRASAASIVACSSASEVDPLMFRCCFAWSSGRTDPLAGGTSMGMGSGLLAGGPLGGGGLHGLVLDLLGLDDLHLGAVGGLAVVDALGVGEAGLGVVCAHLCLVSLRELLEVLGGGAGGEARDSSHVLLLPLIAQISRLRAR